MTFLTSRSICVRAVISFSRSSSSLITATVSVAISLLNSVGYRVEQVVHAELVCIVCIVNRHERIIGPLPVIAHVVVVVDYHHQSAVFVFDSQKLRLQVHSPVDRRRQDIQRLYRKEAIKDRMLEIQLFDLEL